MGLFGVIGDMIKGRLRGDTAFTEMTDNTVFIYRYIKSKQKSGKADYQARLTLVAGIQLQYYIKKGIISDEQIFDFATKSVTRGGDNELVIINLFIMDIWRFCFQEEYKNNMRLLFEIEKQVQANIKEVQPNIMSVWLSPFVVPKTEIHKMYMKQVDDLTQGI